MFDKRLEGVLDLLVGELQVLLESSTESNRADYRFGKAKGQLRVVLTN